MRDVSSAVLAVLAAAFCAESSVAFMAGGGAFLGTQARHPTMSQNMAVRRPTTCMSLVNTDKAVEDAARTLGALLAGATLIVGGAGAALADGSTTKFSLPPISQAKDRCMFKSSAMGQANAARDKLYDLRECDLSEKSAAGFDLSGVIASEANFSKGDFKEVVMSKSYARNSNWEGADFTNAVVDRVSFDGSSMKGAIFQNAVLTSTSFTGADVENADFTDSYMGDFDQKNLCKNPTLKGTNSVTKADTRASAGCRAL
eukprot:jgi/Undpi1/14209/HiC_scaffold_9.g03858.m1